MSKTSFRSYSNWRYNPRSTYLEFVHEKYIAEVKEVLSRNPCLQTLSVGKHYTKNDQDVVRDIVKSSESLGIQSNYNLLSVDVGNDARIGMLGSPPPIGATGFEKEYHEIQYYMPE